MRKREFMRLPLGEYELEDGIFQYYLKKKLTDDKEPMYVIKDKLSGDSFSMFEYKEDIQIDQTPYNVKVPILSICMSVGGVRVHCTDVYWSIKKLKLVPRGSLKTYFEKTRLTPKE